MGSVLFLLGVALSLANGHIQITYYLVLLCLLIYVGYAVRKIKEKAYGEWLKTSLIMAACVVLAVLPNAQGCIPIGTWGSTPSVGFGADAETGCFGKSGEGFHRFG